MSKRREELFINAEIVKEAAEKALFGESEESKSDIAMRRSRWSHRRMGVEELRAS